MKGLPRWGIERHSEHSGGPFTGVGTACQRPGAKRSRRRPAFFAGRGLTGRGPRPYPLPASDWLGSCRPRTLLLTRCRFVFVSVSRKACEIVARRSQSPKPPIVLVVFHRELCSEFAARVALRASAHYRTDAGQSPDVRRTAAHAAATAPIPHLRATLDGSIRLRAERPTAPGGNPLVPAVLQLLCFLW